jgi:thymidylate synthase ThyX
MPKACVVEKKFLLRSGKFSFTSDMTSILNIFVKCAEGQEAQVHSGPQDGELCRTLATKYGMESLAEMGTLRILCARLGLAI